MPQTREELKHCIAKEKQHYLSGSPWGRLKQRMAADPKCAISDFQVTLRREGYYHGRPGLINKLCYFRYHRKRNKQGMKLGLEIWPETFAEGLRIEHAGNIVVNGHARVGKNCVLHGSNCIGNDGFSSQCPILGDNVRLGVGAKVIGDIALADNIVVAAGAVVVHSFDEPGITIAGIPAKKVKG